VTSRHVPRSVLFSCLSSFCPISTPMLLFNPPHDFTQSSTTQHTKSLYFLVTSDNNVVCRRRPDHVYVWAEDILSLVRPALLPATRTLQVNGKLACNISIQHLYIHGRTALFGQGFLFIGVQRSRSDTPHSSGRVIEPVAEAATYTTRNIRNKGISICLSEIRTRDPSKRAAADPRLRPRGHRDRTL